MIFSLVPTDTMYDGIHTGAMMIRVVSRHDASTISDCTKLLTEQGLRWEQDIEGSVIVYDSPDGSCRNPVATGSYSGTVIKCVAAGKGRENSGLASIVMSELVRELHSLGRHDLFLFTRPENKAVFTDLGWYEIETVEDVVTLMENHPRRFAAYLAELQSFRLAPSGDPAIDALPVSALVVNCNPFTNGHLSIIERSRAESSVLYVFVVTEDSSEFSTAERLALVREGVQGMDRVVIIPAGDYLVSRNTFPSYFLKFTGNVDESHARLDCAIFAKHIALALGIVRRYVGEEPFCPVTRNYNQMMSEILPKQGIECRILARAEFEGTAVSASEVRRLFVAGNWARLEHLVPPCTFRFLRSEASRFALERIKARALVNG